MNRLIFDYFRRWSWLLALVSVLEFGLGWFIANRPEDPFEFWGLLLAMWTGANLLSFDLKRGVIRAVTVLPLTARQIGRSWWLATVAIPAIVLAALLYLGAGTFYHFHPDKVIPADRLAIVSLLNVAWLGTMFNCVFATLSFHGKRWELALSSFISGLSVMMLFGGMLLCQNASKSPLKSSILLGVGALLTVASWFRAREFVPGLASFRLVAPPYKDARGQPGAAEESLRRLKALRPPATAWLGLRRPLFDCYIRWLERMAGKNPRGEHHAPEGRGGIPLLINTTFVRTFLTLVAMVALMALIWHWQRQKMPQDMNMTFLAQMGSFMSCFFIFFLQPMPILRHLRFLRTLPISATSLAVVMVATGILPLIALGAVVTGVAWLAIGTAAAITLLKCYTFILAPASLCVFFTVWRGAGMQAYALLLVTMFGFFMAPLWLRTSFHHREIPFSLTGTIAAICVLLAFLLSRCVLLHSSHAYRVQAGPSGNLPWATGG
jgi:uncharacterized membrane protein (UPF0136 family)